MATRLFFSVKKKVSGGENRVAAGLLKTWVDKHMGRHAKSRNSWADTGQTWADTSETPYFFSRLRRENAKITKLISKIGLNGI
mgnify:CR=1 FL=1